MKNMKKKQRKHDNEEIGNDKRVHPRRSGKTLFGIWGGVGGGINPSPKGKGKGDRC